MLLKFFKLFTNNQIEDPEIKYSLNSIQNFVEENINNVVVSSLDELGKTYSEIQKLRRRKEIFRTQLNLCGLGDIASKEFMKSWISDLITQKYGVNQKNIHYAINFDNPSVYMKFSILLYKYKKEYRYDALKKLFIINKLDKLKQIENEEMYAVTDEDIERVYDKEFDYNMKLKFYEKLDILVQHIYENTNGLSVIDETRDMNCDGISIGVSGIPIDFIYKINDLNIKNNIGKKYPMSYDSIWLYLNGKEIYLKFMGFGSQRQLERVCRKLYRFNNQKQFTKSDGHIFNNLADLCRVAVYRPPFAESWAAIIRKFDIDGDLDELIVNENSDIVKGLIYYQMRSNSNVCITGQQGAGKTTMLVASIKKLYSNKTIRVFESYFETFLRIKMPLRNILTLRETEYLNGENALDSLKKSNGQITVISEAAEDKAKAYVIKGALAASECVYWTDHSISPDEIVQTHRNACINVGVLSDENKAEEQVLSVLQWNNNMINDDVEGYRCLDRITEFIRLDTNKFKDDASKEAFHENAKLYFEKKTDAKKYKSVNIIEFDKEKKKYVVKNNISKSRIDYMMKRLREPDKLGFAQLLKRIEEELKC